MHVGLNRASLMYLVVFSVFALGVWAILELGGEYLIAPRDLAGQWTLNDVPEEQPAGFSIEQSGQYVRFHFENARRPVDTILSQNSSQSGAGSTQSLLFAGDGWHVVATGNAASDDLKFSFQAPQGTAAPAGGTYRRQRISSPSPEQSQPAK